MKVISDVQVQHYAYYIHCISHTSLKSLLVREENKPKKYIQKIAKSYNSFSMNRKIYNTNKNKRVKN